MRRVYLLIYINLHCLLICMVNVRLFELKILGGSSQLVSSWFFNSSYKPFRPFGREMLPYWDDPPSSLPCSSPFFSFLLLHLCFFRNMCCKNTWCFYTTCSFLYPTEQWKNPHCLGYIGDYNEPLSGSILNNQYFMESKAGSSQLLASSDKKSGAGGPRVGWWHAESWLVNLLPNPRNKGLVAGLIKENPWLIRTLIGCLKWSISHYLQGSMHVSLLAGFLNHQKTPPGLSTECSGSNAKSGIGSIYSPSRQYIPLIYQVYIAFWSYVIPTTYYKNQKNPLRLVVWCRDYTTGQIISNYGDITRPGPAKYSWEREVPLFQGNLGWWNNISFIHLAISRYKDP